MGKCFIQDSTLKAIADAIRAKTGKNTTMLPSAMAGEIANITTSQAVVEKPYCWRKSQGESFNPYITFTPSNISVLQLVGVTFHDWPSSLVFTDSMMFGKSVTSGNFKWVFSSKVATGSLYTLEMYYSGSLGATGYWDVNSSGTGINISITDGMPPVEFTISFDPISTLEFKGFVCADTAGLYPSNGTHTDGYYYQSISKS